MIDLFQFLKISDRKKFIKNDKQALKSLSKMINLKIFFDKF